MTMLTKMRSMLTTTKTLRNSLKERLASVVSALTGSTRGRITSSLYFKL